MNPSGGRAAFALAATASGILLLAMTFGMTFFADEWAFIGDRSLGGIRTWWPPHNEHWVTLPVLVYRGLVEIVGIGSYVPYSIAVIAVHLVIAGFVYVLLERACGSWPAFAGSLVILLLGSGFENLFWGFQITFLGSVALGLAALSLIDGAASPPRAVAIAVLLLGSFASSGVGAVMAVAIGIEMLLRTRWRHLVGVLVIPFGAYLLWLVAAGRAGLGTFGDPFEPASVASVPATVVRGVANGVGALVGLPGLETLILIPAAGLVAWLVWRSERPPVRFVALLAAVVALYVLTGLTRSGLFEGIVRYTRYTYVAAVLTMIGIGSLFDRVTLPPTRLGRITSYAVVGTWLSFALVTNIGLLVLGRELFLQRADMTRALVTVALAPDRPPGIDSRSLILVPSPADLESLVAAHGDPRSDALVPGSVRQIPPEVMAEARRRLIDGPPVTTIAP